MMMTPEQLEEAERYRAAVAVIARMDRQSVAGTIYEAFVAATIVRTVRTRTRFSTALLAGLASDRLANRAGAELGLEMAVMLQEWVCDSWQYLTDYANDVVVPTPLTDVEARVHRATVELFREADPRAGTAALAYAGAIAVAALRQGDAPAGSPEADAASAWLASDLIAAMGSKELGDNTDGIAVAVGRQWLEIAARAETMRTVAEMEAAA